RSLASGLAVEPAQWRKRARHGFDAGAVMAALKGLLSTGAAAKVAATIAVATTAAVAVSGAHHPARAARAHVGATDVSHMQRASGLRSLSAAVTPSRANDRRVTTAPVHHASHHAALHQSVAAAPSSPASTDTFGSATPASGNASSRERGPAKSGPTHRTTQGLAKGHDKHALAQKAPKSIQTVASP